jgi:hypothetical protein
VYWLLDTFEPANHQPRLVMTMLTLDDRLDAYWTWLQDETETRPIDGSDYIEITTPFLDRHNDYLQIYARSKGDQWYLTDDGYTLVDLEASGCDVSTEKRSKLLITILNRLGVEKEGNALNVHADAASFPQKKHDLVQAMLAVGDLFHTSRATVIGLFLEEVSAWLRKQHVRFTESVKFTGESGYDHHFDFVVPGFRDAPERVLQAINRPDRATVERLIMAWEDTRENRPTESEAIAILNDVEHSVPSSSMEALNRYDICPLPWSSRKDHLDVLGV